MTPSTVPRHTGFHAVANADPVGIENTKKREIKFCNTTALLGLKML